MTTPAFTVDKTQVTTISMTYTPSWTGVPQPIGGTIPVRREVKIRPTTTNNPPRTDGTRPPTGWSHIWAHHGNVFGRPQWRLVMGRDYAWLRSTGSNPLLGNLNLQTVYAGAGAQWCLPGSTSSFPTDCRDLAKTKTLNKLASNRAQLGSALTEFRGTVDTVASAAEHITEGLSSIARAVRAAPRDIAGFLSGVKTAFTPSAELGHDITSLWVEKQYGLRPLIQDIQDAGNSLDEALFERLQSFLLTVRGGQILKSRRDVTFYGPYGAPKNGYSCAVSFEVRTGCYISGTYEVPRTGTRRFQEVGLSNAPAAFWEAVRLSWAVDHVLDAGSWLNSLMAADGTFFREGSESRIMTVSKPSAVFSVKPLGNTVDVSGVDPLTPEFDGGRFERVVLPKAGIMPAFLPSLKPRLGIEFLSNALSVLSQMSYPSLGRRFK